MNLKLRASTVLAGVFGILGIAATIVLASVYNAKMTVMTGDVFLVTKSPPFVGLLSNLGAFAWFGSAVVLMFTVSVIRKTGPKSAVPFLVSSALLSGFLFIDDFFMLHDYWLRRVFGRIDAYFYLVLVGVIALYLFAFRRVIFASNYISLVLAFLFFGASIGMDLVQRPMTEWLGHWQYLVEDGAKWLGICFWLAYWWSLCLRFLGLSWVEENRVKSV